jgi:hypothetical protein
MGAVQAPPLKRLAAWAVSGALLALGMASLLASESFLRPATNPMSDAAPRFQAAMLQGTLLAALLLVLSELAARRWSAPAGGWKAGWFLVGAVFLILGTPLFLSVFEEATALSRRTSTFRLGMGGLYLALGIAACAVAAVRRGSKPGV